MAWLHVLRKMAALFQKMLVMYTDRAFWGIAAEVSQVAGCFVDESLNKSEMRITPRIMRVNLQYVVRKVLREITIARYRIVDFWHAFV